MNAQPIEQPSYLDCEYPFAEDDEQSTRLRRPRLEAILGYRNGSRLTDEELEAAMQEFCLKNVGEIFVPTTIRTQYLHRPGMLVESGFRYAGEPTMEQLTGMVDLWRVISQFEHDFQMRNYQECVDSGMDPQDSTCQYMQEIALKNLNAPFDLDRFAEIMRQYRIAQFFLPNQPQLSQESIMTNQARNDDVTNNQMAEALRAAAAEAAAANQEIPASNAEAASDEPKAAGRFSSFRNRFTKENIMSKSTIALLAFALTLVGIAVGACFAPVRQPVVDAVKRAAAFVSVKAAQAKSWIKSVFTKASEAEVPGAEAAAA